MTRNVFCARAAQSPAQHHCLTLGRFALIAFALSVASSAQAASDVWDANGAVPPTGFWGTAVNWLDNTTPGNLDTAEFYASGTYLVHFGANPAAVQDLIVANSGTNVTFRLSGGSRTLNVNSGGGQDILVSEGARLTVDGFSSTSDQILTLTAGDDLRAQLGATINVQSSAIVNATDIFLTWGGTIAVTGAGTATRLNATSSVNIGDGGNTSTLSFNGITAGSLAPSGTVNVGVTGGAGTVGIFSVAAQSQVDIGNLNVGTGSTAAGIVNVIDQGSLLRQVGVDTITVGAASGGAGTINVGIAGSFATGAQFTTGTGLMTVNPTGTINVGNGSITGTLNANGDVLVNGGAIHVKGDSDFIQSGAKTLIVGNAGGGGGAVNVGSTAPTFTNGTFTTGTGQITINPNASINIGGLTSAYAFNANGNVLVDRGTINLNGGTAVSESAFTQNGNTTLNVGTVSGNAGTINIATTSNRGIFTTGTGQMTIHPNGIVNIGSTGTLNTNGSLVIDRGTLTGSGKVNANGNVLIDDATLTAGIFNLAASKTMTVQNGSIANIGTYTGGASATATVTGAGSQWNGNSLNVASGGAFNVEQSGVLDVASIGVPSGSSMTIDGTASAVSSDGGISISGVVALANNSSGTFAGIVMGAGTLTVGSGADVQAGSIYAPDSNAFLSINGVGSTLTLTPGSPLTVGGTVSVVTGALINIPSADTATFLTESELYVANGGTFNTGNLVSDGAVESNGGQLNVADTLTFNANAQYFVDSPSAITATHLVFDGGSRSYQPFSLGIGITIAQSLTIQNGGLLSFGYDYTTEDITYTITGAGSKLETINDSSALIDNGAQVNVSFGGVLSAEGNIEIANTAHVNVGANGSLSAIGNLEVGNGSFGALSIDGSGASATTQGRLIVGHATTGTSTVDIGVDASGATLTADRVQINATGTVYVGAGSNTAALNVSGDILIDGGLLIRGTHASLNLARGGTVSIQGGGGALFAGSYTTTTDATYYINGAGSGVGVYGGNFVITDGAQVHLTSGGTLDVTGGVVVAGLGTLNTGSSVNAPIIGTSFDGVINVTASGISLGSSASFNGFNHQGSLNISTNTVTLNSAGYARLGVLTTADGGAINALNGIVFPSASNFLGRGAVNARITGEAGSIIEANGALSLGDTASPAGFNFGGELRVRQHTVTLRSSGQATVGNLTTLGGVNGVGVAIPGTLISTNGLIVDFGDAITGYGTVSSTNTLAKRTIINGIAQGTSTAQRLTFTGYIKGVGTFNNVNFTGTFSPGLSPTALTVSNMTLSPTSTLIMELGGAVPGNGHDQILDSSTLTLGGTLQVSLINSFSPVANDSFDLFNWGILSGTFSSISLPTLAGGLIWNTSLLYSTGVISVVAAGVPGDYNQDGAVDAADYVLWRKSPDKYGGDPTGYNIWRSHYGDHVSGSGSGARVSTNVPEPATLLLLIATVGSGSKRRRPT